MSCLVTTRPSGKGRWSKNFKVALLCLLTSPVWAQSPAFDPSFAVTSLYTQAEVRQALQQADGKRLVVGYFERVQGTQMKGIARLLANGNQLDAGFSANVALLQGRVDEALLLPNGQILLATNSGDSLKLNGVNRRTFLRLNSDGSPDPSFDAGTGISGGTVYIGHLLAQPDGKVIVTGNFTQFNGQAAGRITRLNLNGSIDASFQAAGTGLNGDASALLLQTDGKLVVGGTFTTVHGQAVSALVRLQPGGSVDPTFTAQASAGTRVAGAALQADGKVVVVLESGALGGRTDKIQRLTPVGSADASFQQDAQFFSNTTYTPSAPGQTIVCLQPDGKIVIGGNVYIVGQGTTCLARLNVGGGIDASFTVPFVSATRLSVVSTIAPLPNGQLLVAGTPIRFGTATTAPAPVALLNTNGTRDLTLAPNIQRTGSIKAILRQPDGRLVVGGQFNEINGTVASGLARMSQDGVVEPGFTQAGGSVDGEINSLAIQPDGKLLAAGDFVVAGNVSRPTLARFLPTGALDAAFLPAISPIFNYPSQLPTGRRVLYQANGQIVLAGAVQTTTGLDGGLARLNGSTGQVDPSFQPARLAAETQDIVMQANGSYLVAGLLSINSQSYSLCRLLPAGGLDPSFNLTLRSAMGNANLGALAVDGNGNIYVGGTFTAYGAVTSRSVARLLPNGAPDPTFVSGLPPTRFQSVNTLAIQPNGRILLGGSFSSATGSNYGMVRLADDGTQDASFDITQAPGSQVLSILFQPNGAILAGGSFTQVIGLPITGLVRLLDGNVLSVAPHRGIISTQIWPVPAREKINVRFDSALRPTAVQVCNSTGRIVLRQSVVPGETVLDISALAPGIYILTVTYNQAATSHRIVIE